MQKEVVCIGKHYILRKHLKELIYFIQYYLLDEVCSLCSLCRIKKISILKLYNIVNILSGHT